MSRDLLRSLTLSDSVFLIIGNIIGVGIFLNPIEVARQVPEPSWILVAWALGGLMAFAGGLSLARLGILLPKAGGDYTFLTRAWGPQWGFVYGYFSLLITFSGAIAAMASGIATYQGAVFLPQFIEKDFITLGSYSFLSGSNIFALVLIWLLTLINIIGVSRTALAQKVITTPALVLFGLVIVFLFVQVVGYGASAQGGASVSSAGDVSVVSGVGAALVPVFFAYTGWNITLYLAEEVRDPSRSIKRSMVIGLTIVVAIYLLYNFLILRYFGAAGMLEVKGDLNTAFLTSILGNAGGYVAATIIALFVLGSINSTIMGGSRIYYAMAKDDLFFAFAEKVHPRFHTPHYGILIQSVIASLIILVFNDFGTILEYTSLAMIGLSMLTVAANFRYRYLLDRQEGSSLEEGSHKVGGIGFAWPLVYLLFGSFVMLVRVFAEDSGPIFLLVAVGLVLIGLVLYYFWKAIRNS